MKFPSIKTLVHNAADVLRRFPFEMLFALCGTLAAISAIELVDLKYPDQTWSIRIVMAANIGLLASISTTLYSESKGIKGVRLLFFRLIVALLAVCTVLVINPYQHESEHLRFFLLSITLHLLVAFAAFIKPGHVQGFWQFNKTLFLRFLTGFLYSVVLFAGISAALATMNFLFSFNFEWDTFVILSICIAGIFNTFFFLAGVPENILALDQDFSYPKGLKVFTQYVLIPLATVYIMILLAYELKILIQWNLPKGLVSNLILSYAVFGILSLLLVFPVREQAENKWIKTYARSFYFLMLPLIVLLILAAGTRVFQYGITVSRYLLILLACWLLFITIYFLVSRKQNIKLIPISLCLLILLSIYGPQSSFSISKFSQQHILVNILKRNHIFENGKLVPAANSKISFNDEDRAESALAYLINQYDIISLQPYIKKDLKAVSDSLGRLKGQYSNNMPIEEEELKIRKLDWAKKQLGLEESVSVYDIDKIITLAPTKEYFIGSKQDKITMVKGYDFILSQSGMGNDSVTYTAGHIHILKAITNGTLFSIRLNNEKAIFDVKALLEGLLKEEAKLKPYRYTGNKEVIVYNPPSGMLSFDKQTKSFDITFRIDNISFVISGKNRLEKISDVQGRYLVKIK